ncbi:hypothetical protein FRZ06_04175 [Anoxybacterium hadale]|uniref:Uncharacterized protein n=1 Tax=Anoxybacterium hadale TaxID=3408580 RepID=A0ACD1A865_9FIRM|nr:hypothetical protein FRZ06_04175 [Clostridiales bacterium]
MNRTPETNQEVMESLFPEWNKYPLNSLIPVVTKYDNADEPIALSMLYIGDDETVIAFQSELKGGHIDIETMLWIEENKSNLCKDLAMSFGFMGLKGNPTMNTLVSGDNMVAQNELINALYSINHLYLFITDKDGELIKVKQIEWNHEEHIAVLSQFDFRTILN